MKQPSLFKKAVKVLCLGVTIAMAQSASAVLVTQTINFNNLAAGNLGNVCLSVGNGDFCYNGAIQGDPQRAFDVGGGNIVLLDSNRNNSDGSGAVLRRSTWFNPPTTDDFFSVLSMDIALIGGTGSGAPTQVGGGGLNGFGFRIGVDPGGYAWTTNNGAFTTIDLSGFSELQNITAFNTNIVSSGSDYAIDNIVVRYDNGVASVVPEPGSLALLGIALAGFAASRRKKSA